MDAMPEKHSHPVAEGQAFWWTERLWALAAELPVESVDIGRSPSSTSTAGSGAGAIRRLVPSPTTRGASRRLIFGIRSS
jgi:hypothetical protein